MKTIKQAVIIILALLVLANIVTYFYLGTSDRKVGPQITCPDEPLEISAKDNESALLVDVTAKDDQPHFDRWNFQAHLQGHRQGHLHGVRQR